MAAKKRATQVLGYRLYQFGGDHDPVIDSIRTVVDDKGFTLAGLAKDSGGKPNNNLQLVLGQNQATPARDD